MPSIADTDAKGRNPRVLIVTPEVTYLPDRMGNLASCYTAKAGGLADVSAALINALSDQGIDVHVAIPDYRAIFRDRLSPLLQKELRRIRKRMPDEKIHLAEDRAFYYLNKVYTNYGAQNIKLSLAFQREVINNIIPHVQPDLIHCNDWMTGLIPAMARQTGIPCLFTIHNIHTVKAPLAQIEDRGIDAAAFWQNLYFEQMASRYETARDRNPVDFLISGVFAAHFINTVSHQFLKEIIEHQHDFINFQLREELKNKWRAGCTEGILNAPDPGFTPTENAALKKNFGAADHPEGKRQNKIFLQKYLGLNQDGQAPLFFWPSRLDPSQKGCQLLADIFYQVISTYRDHNLQIVFVADGEYQSVFRDIVNFHRFHKRVAVCDFNEPLEHLCYAASDFILMPSLFEPCGLPQMIAPLFGSLPVARDTGGIHDTIHPLNVDKDLGNGFLFSDFTPAALFNAIAAAMQFFRLGAPQKKRQVERIMIQSAQQFNHDVTARKYTQLYERMLQRPLMPFPQAVSPLAATPKNDG